MRKLTAVFVALMISLFGVMAVGVPAAADEPGHRAYGALYLVSTSGLPEMGSRPGYVSHVSGLGQVTVESFNLYLSGKKDRRGLFVKGGTYSASGTLTTVQGDSLQLTIARGEFTVLDAGYTDPATGLFYPFIEFGSAEVSLTGSSGRLAGWGGTGTITEGFMCQFARAGAFAFDVDLDAS